MNFENRTPIRKTAQEKMMEENARAEKKLESFFVDIFEHSTNPEERFNEFEKKLQGFWDTVNNEGGLTQEDINTIKDDFRSCCFIENKEEFIKKGFISLKSLIDWRKDNEALFEVKARKNFIENSGFVPLNEMLSYGRAENNVHIHVAPSKTFSIGAKLSLLKDGLRKLQQVVKDDEGILNVTASSWIVATKQGKGIMEKLGFTVEGEISEEEKEKFFDKEDRPVAEAFITREDFLNNERYK